MHEVYEMPAIKNGVTVNFFRDCAMGSPSPAVVVKEGSRVISVYEHMERREHRNVRHATDPELANPNHRRYGCWDYTPDYKAFQEFRDEIRDRLSAIERRQLMPPASDKDPDTMLIGELRSELSRYEKVSASDGKDALRAKLKAHQEKQGE